MIHVGPPKTGSKYLQSHLFHARTALAAAGVSYPAAWWKYDDEIMHVRLLERLKRGEAAELRAEFAELNGGPCATIVLSCEGFDGLSEDRLELLKALIGPHPVEIVFYCRAWSSRIPSSWRMRVMTGAAQPFPDFYLFYALDPAGSGEINHARVWRRFEQVFGRGSLRIVSLSNLSDAGVDVFEHFCRTFLDLERAPVVPAGLAQRNISPPPEDIETIRVLNALHFGNAGAMNAEMRVKFLAMKAASSIAGLDEFIDGWWRSIEFRDDAEPFKPAWRMMASYADCLASPEYGTTMFTPAARRFDYADPNYLLQSGAFRCAQVLYEQVLATPIQDPQLRFE